MIGSRNHSFEILVIAVLGLAGLVACSSSTSADDGAFSPTISGPVPDGVQVSIPAAALPDGIAPSDITITALPVEAPEGVPDDDPGLPDLILEFAPDGLQLRRPLTVSIPLSTAEPRAYMGFHYSSNGVEPLSIEIGIGEGGPRAEFSISHFSATGFSSLDPGFGDALAAAATAELNPEEQTRLEGDEVQVTPYFVAPSVGSLTAEGRAYLSGIGALGAEPMTWEFTIPPSAPHWFGIPMLRADGPVTPSEARITDNYLQLTAGESYTAKDVRLRCVEPGEAELDIALIVARVTGQGVVTASADPRMVGLEMDVPLVYFVYPQSVAAECIATGGAAATATSVNTGSIEVNTLVIGGDHYPIEQFSTTLPDDCELVHWHSGAAVFSFEELRLAPSGKSGGLTDPDPDICGFGTVAEVPQETIRVAPTEITNYREVLATQ